MIEWMIGIIITFACILLFSILYGKRLEKWKQWKSAQTWYFIARAVTIVFILYALVCICILARKYLS